ncbi:hypothetical protein GC174_09070 [bacterium]|nr:hypothetical protein [bacterium]
MSESRLKEAIASKKMICPECQKPVEKYEKFVETVASVWDGAGDSGVEHEGSKATIICGHCGWKERTEFWDSYIEE